MSIASTSITHCTSSGGFALAVVLAGCKKKEDGAGGSAGSGSAPLATGASATIVSRASAAIRANPRFPADATFVHVVLHEPDKAAIVDGTAARDQRDSRGSRDAI